MDFPTQSDQMTQNLHRQQQQYWKEMTDLKVAAVYMRLYRDRLAKWVTGLGILKAVASSVAIGAWVIWKQYAFLWGAIIATSQVADALKEVFPFAKRHKAASELTLTYANLFIDAQLEWENIFSGRFTDDEIINRLHKFRKLLLDAERSSFPDGLATKPDLFEQAQMYTQQYFANTYQV